MTKHEWERVQAVIAVRTWTDWHRKHGTPRDPEAIAAKVEADFPWFKPDDVAYVVTFGDRKARWVRIALRLHNNRCTS